MNELEKKQHFSMKNLSDTVTTTPIRDDIYQLEPLKEVIPPKYKTLSQAYREFSFRKEMIDDIQAPSGTVHFHVMIMEIVPKCI